MVCASTLRSTVLIFFFFQAEDGIRDWSVTGVQTCALPISRAWQVDADLFQLATLGQHHHSIGEKDSFSDVVGNENDGRTLLLPDARELFLRSEERRVGKEGRCRGAPEI